jgi:hypothetical protein
MTTGYLQNCVTIYELAKDGNGTNDFHHKYFGISLTKGFTIPLNLSAVSGHAAQSEHHIPLSTVQMNTTMKCINSTHATLDAFLGMTIKVMRQVPGVLYVRATHAILILINISLIAAESDLGEYLDIKSLKLDFYFDTMLRCVEEASGPEQYKIPSHWLQILYRIKGWYDKRDTRTDQGQSRDCNALYAMDQQNPENSTAQLPTNDSQWDSTLSAHSFFDSGGKAFPNPNTGFGDKPAATIKPQGHNTPRGEEQRRPSNFFPGNLEPSVMSSVPMDSLDFDDNYLSIWGDSAVDSNSWTGNDVFGDMNYHTMGDNQNFDLG